MTLETSNPEMRSLPYQLTDEHSDGASWTSREPGLAYLVHAQRARILAAMQRGAEAVAELEQALAQAPDRPELFVELAGLQRALAQPALALAALQRCTRQHPDHLPGWQRLVELLVEGDRAHEARRTLQAAIERHRGQPALLGCLAELCLRQGEREAALDALVEQVWNQPADRTALGRLLVLARALGDDETVDSALALASQHRLDEAVIADAARWLHALLGA